jgi:O-antigen ligase
LVSNDTRKQLYIILLSSTLFLNTSSEGLSVLDVLTGVFYLGSLSLWFFRAKFVYHKNIIRNFADILILIFFSFAFVFWIPLSLLSGVELLNILREIIIFSLILLYFPFRDEFKTKDDLKDLLLVVAISIIGITFISLIISYKKLHSIEFVFQLGGGVRTNQFLGGVSVIFSIILFYIHRGKKAKILITSVLFLSMVSLIISISRIYWFGTMLGFLIATIFISGKERFKIYFTAFAIFATIILSVVLYFGKTSELILGFFQKRLSSSQGYKKDISFLARIQEYEAVWEHIKEFPLGGNGISKEYSYYNLISQTNWHVTFVHNGYISLVYRFGFPMALIFYLFLIYYFWQSFSLSIWNKNQYSRTLSACVLAAFCLLFITNFFTTTVMFRDFYIYFPILITILSIAKDISKDAHQS